METFGPAEEAASRARIAALAAAYQAASADGSLAVAAPQQTELHGSPASPQSNAVPTFTSRSDPGPSRRLSAGGAHGVGAAAEEAHAAPLPAPSDAPLQPEPRLPTADASVVALKPRRSITWQSALVVEDAARALAALPACTAAAWTISAAGAPPQPSILDVLYSARGSVTGGAAVTPPSPKLHAGAAAVGDFSPAAAAVPSFSPPRPSRAAGLAVEASTAGGAAGAELGSAAARSGLWRQFRLLSWRASLIVLRDTSHVPLVLLRNTGLSLLLGVLWLNAARARARLHARARQRPLLCTTC